jgi:Zn-dependent M28 family amino/carboxypeptidase
MVSADALPRTVALILAIVPAISLVFTLQPDFSPYVKGANDDASGAAAVLTLAERLKAEPLRHTAVFLVNTGCEEVGGYGIRDWIERHADEADDADYLVLNTLAGAGAEINYVVDETLLMPVSADDDLVALAEEVAGENPTLGAKPAHFQGLFSELSIATVAGQRALGLMNLDPRTGTPPRFHTAADDMSNIDSAVLERSEQFAWAILKKLDADAGEPQAAALAEGETAGEAADAVNETPATAETDTAPEPKPAQD